MEALSMVLMIAVILSWYAVGKRHVEKKEIAIHEVMAAIGLSVVWTFALLSIN